MLEAQVAASAVAASAVAASAVAADKGAAADKVGKVERVLQHEAYN